MPRNVVQPCLVPCGTTDEIGEPTEGPGDTGAGGLSTGAIIGIAAGLIGAALLLAVGAVGYFLYNKKGSPYRRQAPSQSVQSLTPNKGESNNPLYAQ